MRTLTIALFILINLQGFAQSHSVLPIEYQGRQGYFITPALAFSIIDSALSFQSWKKFTSELRSRADSIEKKLKAFQKLDRDNKIYTSTLNGELEQSQIVHKIDDALIKELNAKLLKAGLKITWLKIKGTTFEIVAIAGATYVLYDVFLKK